MSGIGDAVWERRGAGEMSRNLFMFLYGVFTFLGLAFTAVGAWRTLDWVQYGPKGPEYVGPNILALSIGVLVISIIGILIALGSDNPLVSLFGYALVAGPFGLILGPTVALYTPASVLKVVFVTLTLTALLALMGAALPGSLEGLGSLLFGGICILLIGQFGIPLAGWLFPGFPLEGALTLWDWVGVFLFGAYVVFDVNRAARVPATLDNAIDCALALYLDIINLFVRLIEIMGTKRDD